MKKNHSWFLPGGIAIFAILLAFLFNSEEQLRLLGDITLILIVVVVHAFVFVYSRRNWRANPYGRALMYSKISLAVMVDLALILILFGPEWEHRPLVRYLGFLGILVAQTRLLQLLFSVRNEKARVKYDVENVQEEGWKNGK